MNEPSADVGFLDYALALLEEKREREPDVVEAFLLANRLDKLVECESYGPAHVVMWPSRVLLEFINDTDENGR